MTPYTKTEWINDETDLNETNMNKIEEQLELLTNNAISESEKGYITDTELEKKKYIDETELNNKNYVTTEEMNTAINNAIGGALDGSY